MIRNVLSESNMLSLLGLVVSVAPLGLAVLYAIKPRESLLVLVRPLSLAAIFGGLMSFTVGLTIILVGVSATGTFGWRGFAAGVAESLVALIVTFGCLTLTWLLVALGLRRTETVMPPPVEPEPPAR